MTLEQIRAAVELALSPGRFFVSRGTVACDHQGNERTPWEIVRGQLLAHRQTRQEATFETWSVMFHASAGVAAADAVPQHIISLKFAAAEAAMFATICPVTSCG